MCGCGYLNGWIPTVGMQMFLMIGMLFSVAALGDCSFLELDNRLFFPSDMDDNDDTSGTKKGGNYLPIEVTQTQFVGFLTWKNLDGSCYYYNSGVNPNEQIHTFIEILGTGWEIPRICGGLSAALSFVFFCYALSFTCSSQVRGVRYFNTVFLCIVLTTLQGLTFYTFDTNNNSFCEEYGCIFSRSAGFSAVAMGCFFLSGLCFCFTHDYPGPRWKSPQIAPAEMFMSTSTTVPQRAASKFPIPFSADEESNERNINRYADRFLDEESKTEEVVSEMNNAESNVHYHSDTNHYIKGGKAKLDSSASTDGISIIDNVNNENRTPSSAEEIENIR